MAPPRAIQVLIERADHLTRDGVKLVESRKHHDSGAESVDSGLLAGWFARAETLARAAPNGAAHYVEALERARTKNVYMSGNVVRLEEAISVVGSLLEDLANGPMSDVVGLVRAEVFGDLLEQAEHLLENGYDVAAAVIAGAVLEDHLRKLCVPHGVTPTKTSTLNWLNDELARVKAYEGVQKKQITHLAAIRNDAAHGNGITRKQAEDIVNDVPRVILALPI